MIIHNFAVLVNRLSEEYNYNSMFESLAEFILQSCNTSCGKPSDDHNYMLVPRGIHCTKVTLGTLANFHLSSTPIVVIVMRTAFPCESFM